jgi:hypothetical protein
LIGECFDIDESGRPFSLIVEWKQHLMFEDAVHGWFGRRRLTRRRGTAVVSAAVAGMDQAMVNAGRLGRTASSATGLVIGLLVIVVVAMETTLRDAMVHIPGPHCVVLLQMSLEAFVGRVTIGAILLLPVLAVPRTLNGNVGRSWSRPGRAAVISSSRTSVLLLSWTIVDRGQWVVLFL